MRTTYTVVYRMGGYARCWWNACVPVTTIEKAQEFVADIERGGRKALIFKTADLDAIGMPEGWDAG